MIRNLENGDMIALARILSGNVVDSAAVAEAFKLLCEKFGCECGLVYDLDYTGDFYLKEHYEVKPMELCEQFTVRELAFQKQLDQKVEKIYFINRDDEGMPHNKNLLDLYGSESVIMVPVADGKGRTYGIVLMLNADEQVFSDEKTREALSDCLFMLVRYVAMRMYERMVEQAQTALESILDNTGIDIYVNDFYNHDILYVNKSMAAPYGGKKEFMGEKCWRVLFPGQGKECEFCPQNKLIDENGEPTKVYTWDYQRAFDGSWFRVFSAAFRWIDGRMAHVVSSADITDNKRNEALIENLANYDQLTKLPNRRMLIAECERRINKATENEKGYIMFFDIDGFKAINDNYGHDAGDEFLVQLGEFFNSIPLLKGAAYRNGGDEFVAVLGGEEIGKNTIRSLAGFIHARFKKPWILKNGEVFCDTSIGVACFPEDGRNAEELLRVADMAMYHVKKNGGADIYFGSQLKEDNKKNSDELK